MCLRKRIPPQNDKGLLVCFYSLFNSSTCSIGWLRPGPFQTCLITKVYWERQSLTRIWQFLCLQYSCNVFVKQEVVLNRIEHCAHHRPKGWYQPEISHGFLHDSDLIGIWWVRPSLLNVNEKRSDRQGGRGGEYFRQGKQDEQRCGGRKDTKVWEGWVIMKEKETWIREWIRHKG